MPSKAKAVNIIVEYIAKSDDNNEQNIKLKNFLLKILISLISVKTIIPRVANIESQSDMSYIEYGDITQITDTAIKRDVIGSLFVERRNKVDEIISIRLALTTDGENPTNAE